MMNIYSIIAKFYDLLDYTYFRNYNRSPRKVVNEVVGDHDKVLDICTGTASNAIQIAQSNPEAKIAAIDISKEMLQIAKKKVKDKNIENIKIYCMDATSLKFKSETFDKISIALILHEMETDTAKKLILEAKRVLKDNGQIIVTEWEPEKCWFRKLLFLPIYLLEPKTYQEFIKKDMNMYFKELGLSIVETIYCDYSKVMIVEKTAK